MLQIANMRTWVFYLMCSQASLAYYVTIQNISKCCSDSDSELADFTAELSQGQLSDQEISGRLVLPMDIDENAEMQYEASIWDDYDHEWKYLYKGVRSVCRSLVKSLPYQHMADDTSFPNDCPINQGTYHLDKYPVSGQYVVFNTVRGTNPLVKHRLHLLQDNHHVLCRVIYTMSHE